MKTREYLGEIMPDGHLSLPESVAKELELKPKARVRVIIEKDEPEEYDPPLPQEAKKTALLIKQFCADMGPEDLSERFREKYK